MPVITYSKYCLHANTANMTSLKPVNNRSGRNSRLNNFQLLNKLLPIPFISTVLMRNKPARHNMSLRKKIGILKEGTSFLIIPSNTIVATNVYSSASHCFDTFRLMVAAVFNAYLFEL